MTEEVDLRSGMLPVRDQDQRPICTAFAVSACHEWAGGVSVRSVEDVIWAAHEAGAEPAMEAVFVYEALAGLQGAGHASEESWPLGSPPWPAGRPPEVFEPDQIEPLPDWREVVPASYSAVTAELAQGLAIVILTLNLVVAAWQSAAADGRVDAGPNFKTPGSHAVLAVGFRGANGSHQGELIIRNSWGTDWGDEGYGYVSEAYLDAYVVAAHVMEGKVDSDGNE
jgi:hypothetical protein